MTYSNIDQKRRRSSIIPSGPNSQSSEVREQIKNIASQRKKPQKSKAKNLQASISRIFKSEDETKRDEDLGEAAEKIVIPGNFQENQEDPEASQFRRLVCFYVHLRSFCQCGFIFTSFCFYFKPCQFYFVEFYL